MIFHLDILQEQYVICPIDEALSSIVFICKKYYVQVLLKELGLLNTTLNTCQQLNDTLHNVLQQENETLSSVFELKNINGEFSFLHVLLAPKNA